MDISNITKLLGNGKTASSYFAAIIAPLIANYARSKGVAVPENTEEILFGFFTLVGSFFGLGSKTVRNANMVLEHNYKLDNHDTQLSDLQKQIEELKKQIPKGN